MGAQGMEALHGLPGHLVRRLQQTIQSIYEAETRGFGVTAAQFSILLTVSLSPGMEQREVAERACYDSVTTSQIVRRLLAMGLVRREKGAKSRRGHALHLTEAGAALLHQIAPAIARVQERLMQRLPQERRQDFLDLLRIVAGPDGGERQA